MDKKKILIVNKSLKTGGVQRALVNLVQELHNEFDISLYLFYPDGEFKKQLPDDVKILTGNRLLQSMGMTFKQAIKSKNFFVIIFRIFGALWSKLFKNTVPIVLAINSQKKVTGFDLAISYIQDSNNRTVYSGCNEFVLKKVVAPRKIAWIHGDYERSGLNNEKNKVIYAKFDRVVTVSKGCKQALLNVLPELKDKVSVAYNFYNINEILELSNAFMPEFKRGDALKIVTVARLGWEKGHLRAIDAIKRLADDGFEFEWYIIGDGFYKKQINNKVMKYGLQDKIILLGSKTNPYPYIKHADLFFLPSLHEAAPMTIGEAKICNTPILATNYISAEEQIDIGKDGLITENSAEGIYQGLKSVLSNKEIIEEFKRNLKEENFDNELPYSQHKALLLG